MPASRWMPSLQLTRLALGDAVTPVERLMLPGAAPLWVKREDRSGDLYGGNKVRKLAWVLAQAQQGNQHVLSLGARGSNHLIATTLYGQAHGLKVHSVVFPQPETPHVSRNYAWLRQRADSLWHSPSMALAPAWAAALWLRTTARERGAPLLIDPGASSPLGTLGWVEGGMELGWQVQQGLCPEPTDVFVALGSGGTAAGLLLGLQASGLRSRVHAVAVVARPLANRGSTLRLARATARLMAARGGPLLRPDAERLRVHHDQLGRGYGHSTQASEAATALAQRAGLYLEGTYTGKALAACLKFSEMSPGACALFVNTVNSRSLPPAAG